MSLGALNFIFVHGIIVSEVTIKCKQFPYIIDTALSQKDSLGKNCPGAL